MKELKEAHVVVDGTTLSIGESMTLRVALTMFAHDLSTHGLGDDEHGKFMKEAYINNIRKIMSYMVRS